MSTDFFFLETDILYRLIKYIIIVHKKSNVYLSWKCLNSENNEADKICTVLNFQNITKDINFVGHCL